jgi:hypothetical protein
VVNYFKKSEQAQAHLNKCIAFKKVVFGWPREQRPTWYNGGKRARSDTSSSGSDSGTQLRVNFLKALSQEEIAKFEDLLAMHWYVTGNAFQRIAEPHLLEALKVRVFHCSENNWLFRCCDLM